MTSDSQREREIFERLAELPTAARTAALDRECGSDVALRRRLEARLKTFDETMAHSNARGSESSEGESSGDRGTREPATDAGRQSARSTMGLLIADRYRLVEMIGEGGMGEVWRAEQIAPVKRQVALKLIRTGRDSRAVLTRFNKERQALAIMDHPHIARVLDGGVAPSGQPFFVMELVAGSPLDEYCDGARMTPRERLELFVPICQAVQHAHQKGIVHRDLKPANILVTSVDGKPVPKVIDFGIAKAVSGELLDDTTATQVGDLLGTFEYMSPEQAGLSGEDVDTRTDIYALGIILYELLTGLRPFDARRMRRAALAELIRIIREEEPSRPSTRLETSESSASMAALRQTEPKKLMALLRGELDWVVLKCLEKDRERRYESADGLAKDIQRYLADEPVEARPPSLGYRMTKLIRRNKGKVLAAGLLLLALIGGIVGTSVGLVEAKRQRLAAEQARDSAQERAEAEARERRRAEQAEAETQKRADELEQVASLQSKLFEDLDTALAGVRLRSDFLVKVRAAAEASKRGPEEVEARVADAERAIAGADFAGMVIKTLEENVLVPALETVGRQFADQPLVRARLQQTLSDTLLQLGMYDLALPPQEAALATRRAELGDEDLDTLESIRSLSGLLRRRDEFDRAEPLLAEALEGFRKVCGDEDPRTLECLHMVAVLRGAQGRTAEELEAYQTALPRFREILGEEHRDTLELMGNYGSALMGAGRLEEAEKLLVEAHAKLARGGMDTRRAITATNNLGTLNVRLNRLDEAERLYRQSLAGLRRTFGDWHPNTISNVENIAGLLSRRQQTEEAKVLMAEVLERRRLLFGDGDLQTLRSVHNMAVLNRDEKDDAAAEAGFREAYEGFSRLLGPDRPDTLYIASSLARVLRYQRKLEEAEGLYRLILQSRMRSPGPAHPSTLDTVVDLANVLGERGRTEDALRLMQEHEPGARTVYSGPRQRQLGDYLSLLGDAYAKADRFREGEAVSSEARSMLTRSYGEASDAVTRCVDRQIALLRRWELAEPSRGHQAKADALIEETLALFTRELEKARRGNPSDSPALASALAGVGARLLTFGRFAEAEPLLREAFTIREAALPDDWLTFNASSLLGGTLLGLARYTDAEPLLVNGYEGLEAREKSIPRQLEYCLDDAIERLVQLYTETGTPEVAERWRSRRVTLTIK